MSNLNRAGIIAVGAALAILTAAGCSKKEEPPPVPSDTGKMMGGGGPMMGGRPGIGGGPMMGGGPGMGGRRRGGGGGPVAADATGDQIYQQKCGCHGPNGAGGNAPKLAGIHDSEDELTKTVHDGKGRMPAFGSQLTDDQIKKVVTYIKGIKS